MNTTRTLAYAALAAVSLGVGSAMAQESADPDFWNNYNQQMVPANRQAMPMMSQPQAGSSDVSQARTPTYADPVILSGDGGA